MREELRAAQNAALKAKDKLRSSTLRLINAAIKERDIDARGQGKGEIGNDDILALLQKMVKQREESAKIYAEAGRDELAAQERAEIEVIEEFLPQMLSDKEVARAVDAEIADAGAESMKDMGRVVSALKAKYPGQLDMGAVSKLVRAKLAG